MEALLTPTTSLHHYKYTEKLCTLTNLEPPRLLIIMKYGVHAGESVNSIISRKKEELARNGQFFWGYGGTVCHPINQVHKLAAVAQQANANVHLALVPTRSSLHNFPSKSHELSIDKLTWTEIPEDICIVGSKYALVCDTIARCDFQLDLSKYEVATGVSSGRRLDTYLRGRVDKACANLITPGTPLDQAATFVKVDYMCRLASPFAVFLR